MLSPPLPPYAMPPPATTLFRVGELVLWRLAHVEWLGVYFTERHDFVILDDTSVRPVPGVTANEHPPKRVRQGLERLIRAVVRADKIRDFAGKETPTPAYLKVHALRQWYVRMLQEGLAIASDPPKDRPATTVAIVYATNETFVPMTLLATSFANDMVSFFVRVESRDHEELLEAMREDAWLSAFLL